MIPERIPPRIRLLFTSASAVYSNGTTPVTTANAGTTQLLFYDDMGTFLNFGKAVSYEGGPDAELVPAPEPSTYVMALGLVALAAYRERRRFSGLVPAWLKV